MFQITKWEPENNWVKTIHGQVPYIDWCESTSENLRKRKGIENEVRKRKLKGISECSVWGVYKKIEQKNEPSLREDT